MKRIGVVSIWVQYELNMSWIWVQYGSMNEWGGSDEENRVRVNLSPIWVEFESKMGPIWVNERGRKIWWREQGTCQSESNMGRSQSWVICWYGPTWVRWISYTEHCQRRNRTCTDYIELLVLLIPSKIAAWLWYSTLFTFLWIHNKKLNFLTSVSLWL